VDRLGGSWSEWLWRWSVALVGFQGDWVLVMGWLMCSSGVCLERDCVGGIVLVSVGVQLGPLVAACWWSLGTRRAEYWWCHWHPHNWSSGGCLIDLNCGHPQNWPGGGLWSDDGGGHPQNWVLGSCW
jgi:hypothetical protein